MNMRAEVPQGELFFHLFQGLEGKDFPEEIAQRAVRCFLQPGGGKNIPETGEIEGKTLGIVGYGRIGSSLGRKANALGMRIIAYNPPPRHEDKIVTYVDEFDAFLSQADVISIHAPLTEDTKNIINKESIAKMKDGVYIINTARGGTVDEDALYEACKSGKLAGAALDVYTSEPYKGRLLELDNVYFTPHLGGSTKEAQMRIGRELISIIKKGLGD